jgi:hypothetical protein
MKKRARIVSGLAAFVALFLAARADASLTRSSNPAREAPALALTLAAPEPSEFSLFEGTEIARALASRPAFDLISITTDDTATAGRRRFVSPSELSADELPNDAPELLPITSVRQQRFNLQLPPNVFGLEPLRGPPGDEASYPKTRYPVFGLLGTPILGELRGVSLELHWRSASFSCGFASGTVGWLSQDPMGDRDSVNLYGFVGMRPHEATDPLGLALGDWWDPRTYADAQLAKDLGHDLLNAASLGTLNRVEKQKNLGTASGVLESVFNAGRSVSNAASFGLQEEIYESQMRNGPGLASVGQGVQNWAYNLTPMEEIRQLAQEGDQMTGGEKAVAISTAISKTAGLLAGAKSFGEAGAARYYRSRVTATYQRAVADYEAQGMSPTKVGQAADKATKIWARRNLKDFSQVFDPATGRTHAESLEGARPDILLPKYGEGLELKSTFDAAWRAQGQFGNFVDLFPEYNIEYVLGKGGWVSPTGTPASLRAYLRSVLANAGQQGKRP